jgi:hypothetical protein
MLRWLVPAGLVAIGCGTQDPQISRPLPQGGGGVGGAPLVDQGIGESCNSDKNCRSGLLCDAKLQSCQPGHTNLAGAPCQISDECVAGLYCGGGKCLAEGDGKEGDGCDDDADCKSGLRCAFVSLSAITCQPQGKTDVGDACSKSTDCFAGAHCADGKCKTIPKGGKPFGKTWAGETCEPESGPVRAYFTIPRKDGKDGDFFRLPFPNDVRLSAGGLDLSGFPTPGTEWLGYDLVARYLDIAKTNVGFGAYSAVYFRFSGELDIASFDKQIAIVDLDDDVTLSYVFTYTLGQRGYVCTNRVMVSRLPGNIWQPGKRYAVLVFDGIRSSDGKSVAQPPDLTLMLHGTAPSDAAVLPHWGKYQPLRSYLAKHAIDPGKVVQATQFTVGQPRALVDAVAKGVAAFGAPKVTGWTRCDEGVKSPCPDATGDRACAKANPGFDELHALVELPSFQQGAPPYLDSGGSVTIDGGKATVSKSEQVCLSLTVPSGVPPAEGWPVVVFAHGTGGHFRSHVTSGLAATMAAGVDDGYGNIVKAGVLGIDQALFGPRKAGSSVGSDELFFNLANPSAIRGNALQSAADQLSLLSFTGGLAFTDQSSPTKKAFKLGKPVAFWGHGQGANAGALALSHGGWRGAVFAGISAGARDLLVTKKSPWNMASVLAMALQDYDSSGKLHIGADNPVLAMMQLALDATDPMTFSGLGSDRHVLQIFGTKDTFTPDQAQANWVLAADLGLAWYDPSAASSAVGIGSLKLLPVPASGNRTVGKDSITAIAREYGPPEKSDGHFVMRDVANAKSDGERFVAGILSGAVPKVGK